MKKLNYLASVFAAAGMLLSTSCSQEEFDVTVPGQPCEVTFVVSSPNGVTNRAYSDGLTATELQYAVYDANGKHLTALDGTAEMVDGATTVNLQLVAGSDYTLIFWSAAPNAPYTVTFTENLDDANLQVSYDGAACNDEARDAFFKVFPYKADGNQPETVKLRRPFAQLNIGTNDWEDAVKAGFTPKSTSVTTTGYTTMKFNSGAVEGEREITFELADIVSEDQKFPVEGNRYLAMNYILMGTDAEPVDVFFTCVSEDNQVKEREFNVIDLERNHRTNIYGKLLTSSVDFNVVIEEDYDDPAHNYGQINVAYDKSKTPEQNGKALFETIMAAADGAIIKVAPGEYFGTDGQTSRYKLNKSITIEGEGDGVILSGAKYGRVIDSETKGNVVTIKNVTIESKGVGSAIYAKNYVTLNLENVKTVTAQSSTAILLDACNTIGGVHPGDQQTRVNASNVEIEVGEFVELNANPCNAYPTAEPTEAYFTFDADCKNITVVRPQSVCINQGNNLFVNGEAIPVGYYYVGGEMVQDNGSDIVIVSTAAELTEATQNATDGLTIYVAGFDGGVATLYQKENVNVTIDGMSNTISGQFAIHGRNAGTSPETITIKNVNFLADDATVPCITQASNTSGHATTYAHNVTIENCTFKSAAQNYNAGAMNFNTVYNLLVQNCVAENLHSLLQAQSVDTYVTVKDVTVTNCKNGVSFGNTAFPTIDNAQIIAEGYGIRCDGNASRGILKASNLNITANIPVAVRKLTTPYQVEFTGANTLNAGQTFQVVLTKNNDEAVLEVPTGAYKITGDENFCVYPKLAFINGVAYESLDAALTAVQNGQEIVLRPGVYNAGTGKNKTFTLTGEEGVVLQIFNEGEDGADYGFQNSTVTFNNIKFDTSVNAGNYKGYAYMNNSVFNNCEFSGAYCSYMSQSFNNCEFDFKNGYFWVWGANELNFDNCVFNGNSKCLLAHGGASTVININDCQFAATEQGFTGAGDNTACVEIDPTGSNKYTINFTGTNTKTDAYSGWTRVKDGTTGHTVTGI